MDVAVHRFVQGVSALILLSFPKNRFVRCARLRVAGGAIRWSRGRVRILMRRAGGAGGAAEQVPPYAYFDPRAGRIRRVRILRTWNEVSRGNSAQDAHSTLA